MKLSALRPLLLTVSLSILSMAAVGSASAQAPLQVETDADLVQESFDAAQKAGQPLTDMQRIHLATAIRENIARDARIADLAKNLEFKSDGDKIAIVGTVKTRAERRFIMVQAQKAVGWQIVTDLMQLERDAS